MRPAGRAGVDLDRLIHAADIEDLISQLKPERASLRYATTPMAIELIARKPA